MQSVAVCVFYLLCCSETLQWAARRPGCLVVVFFFFWFCFVFFFCFFFCFFVFLAVVKTI